MAKQPSSIDRLPDAIKEEIGRLRVQGRTIDEILAHLRALNVEVSRSALGRHTKRLETLKERMQSSRDLALALVNRFGEEPDNKLAQLNLELMHSVVLQTITAARENEDGEMEPVTFDPEQAMFLASALQKLASADKLNAERIMKIQAEVRERTTKEAAKAVDQVAKRQGGLTRETVEAIKAEILGIRA